MSQVNLSRFQFDYDLTFAMTTHFANGRSMSRFGARNEVGPRVWLTAQAIETWLGRCLAAHQKWLNSKPVFEVPKPQTGKSIMDVPAFSNRLKGRKLECVHCHSVQPALRREAIARKKWTAHDKFVSPDPKRVGLSFDAVRQTTVEAVIAGSSAEALALKAGDQILSLGSTQVLSISDFQFALHRAKASKTKIPITWVRDGQESKGSLSLVHGWKVCSPWEFAWRPMKWELSPAPGFGGRVLGERAKVKLGLARQSFALRIDYLVDWGPRGVLGKNAKKAGLRKGDILLSVNGKSDFISGDHFHSWVRLSCKVGQELRLQVKRGGKKTTLKLVLVAG
ncbi:MAG: hypothetical protein ACI97A_001160 [Planctomycetota bacterium]|jgi:hypothetical protein